MFFSVPTPAEMSLWDARTIALGFPEEALMENAARAAFACLKHRYGKPLKDKNVLLFAGGGNNGGDAFCMARILQDAGANPSVVCTRPPKNSEGAAKRWFDVLCHLEIPLAMADDWLLSGTSVQPDIIIDGLLGTGFKGMLREKEKRLVERINSMRKPFVLSIDIPSGLDGLTGLPGPVAVFASATVSFQAPKPGLLMPAASPYTGTLDIYPIGMPEKTCTPASYRTWRMPDQEKDGSAPWTVFRQAESARFSSFPQPAGTGWPRHKGEAGKILVIGGCAAYAGAPCLTALAAMRAGCGLVALAAPDPVQAVLRQICPAAISVVFQGDACNHEWNARHIGTVVSSLEKYDAVVLGPGLGRGDAENALVEAVISAEGRPGIIADADALYALSLQKNLFSRLTPHDIITPHPGEAAYLLGCSPKEIQSNRFDSMQKLTSLFPSACILKGEGTLISSRSGPPVISPWAVPQLAVAGSGDVLAGIAAAFLARGMSSMEASVLAVWTHALAGVSLAGKFPMRGNSPSDIAERIPIGMQWAGVPSVRPE